MLPYASMRLTDEELLEKLEKEQGKLQSELDARKAKLNARTQPCPLSPSSARERKTDTRRKILVGAMMLKLSDQHPNIKEFMVKHLDDFLEHTRDRELFDDLTDRLENPLRRLLMASVRGGQLADRRLKTALLEASCVPFSGLSSLVSPLL